MGMTIPVKETPAIVKVETEENVNFKDKLEALTDKIIAFKEHYYDDHKDKFIKKGNRKMKKVLETIEKDEMKKRKIQFFDKLKINITPN